MLLPAHRFDTSYVETRHVGWDAYVNVRGNRYSVPSAYCGQMVTIRLSLDDELSIKEQATPSPWIPHPQDRLSARGHSEFPTSLSKSAVFSGP